MSRVKVEQTHTKQQEINRLGNPGIPHNVYRMIKIWNQPGTNTDWMDQEELRKYPALHSPTEEARDPATSCKEEQLKDKDDNIQGNLKR